MEPSNSLYVQNVVLKNKLTSRNQINNVWIFHLLYIFFFNSTFSAFLTNRHSEHVSMLTNSDFSWLCYFNISI